MFEVSVRTHFSAAHRLNGHQGGCANPHGHNWEVTVFVRGEELDEIGVLVDFRQVKKALAGIIDELDHADLNKLSAFSDRNPTSENIAVHIHAGLCAALDSPVCSVHRVTVCETPGSEVSYWGPGQE